MYAVTKDFKGWRKKWLSLVRRHARMLGALVRGLPAVAAFVGVVYLAVTIVTQRKDHLVGRYLDRAVHAMRVTDYRVARVGYERLTQLDPSRPEFKFGLALSLFGLGDFSPAVGLMQGLAPVNEEGFTAAHLWQAQRLLMGTPAQADRDAAKAHLHWVLQQQPNDPDGNALMANAFMGDGRLDRAKPFLLRSCNKHRELELSLARVFASEYDKDNARLHGNLAFAYYQRLVKEDPNNKVARLGLADAALFMGDFETAQKVLEDGLKQTGDMTYRLALSRVYMQHAHYLSRKTVNGPFKDRMELLSKAVQFDFSNLDALQGLLGLSELKGAEAEKARKALHELLAQGASPGVNHFILGLEAQHAGQDADARKHFEFAYKAEPTMLVAMNNLAWSLANVKPVDLPRALKMMNSLLERAPTQANFRETRGQIYAKMKRWNEAVADLEFALPHMPNSRAVHETLAEAYKQLDMPESAKPHRSILEKLPR